MKLWTLRLYGEVRPGQTQRRISLFSHASVWPRLRGAGPFFKRSRMFLKLKSDYIHGILVGCISRWNGGATASLRRSQTAGWHGSREMLSHRWEVLLPEERPTSRPPWQRPPPR